MDTPINDVDDLYVAIILALSVTEVLSLPDNVTFDELARRYPETYEKCAETLKAQNRAKTSKICAKFTDSSDGT